MLYYLFNWLNKEFHVPGTGLFQFLTFRIAMSVILSLVIATVYGKRIILFLKKKQIGESVRDLGLEGQTQKKGTPTMGGIIILLSILIPTLLFANLDKVYIRLMVLCTVWLGVIGFLDDYFKIRARQAALEKGLPYKKKDSDGLAGVTKIIGQIGLGIIIGVTLYFSNAVTVEREVLTSPQAQLQKGERLAKDSNILVRKLNGIDKKFVKVKTPITTIPFVKEHQFNYSRLVSWIGPGGGEIYLDRLYPDRNLYYYSSIQWCQSYRWVGWIGRWGERHYRCGYRVFVYVSGNYIFADYFDVMYIPNLGELSIFVGAFVGACIGFLWYNAFPAQVFMGDTGSLALGGIIASLAIIVRKELLIPIFCGVFLVENLSVIMQVAYFKYTKRKFGEGRRIFLMSPLHHHYQKKGFHESKIAVRFWIITIICVVMSIVTLKIR
jgi:phospho-N-acetylmuramoyl-pentapeptide-transferase